MSHLILATNDLAAYNLRGSQLANAFVGFDLRFVGGPQRSTAELTTLLEPRSAKHDVDGKHWLDHFRRLGDKRSRDWNLGFLAFCQPFDSVAIWVDPQPNDQLILVWLLDALRPYREVVSKLSLVQADDRIANYLPKSLSEWKLPEFKITDRHLELASKAWQAYRAPSPEGCFDLMLQDTTILPRLRPAMIALLEELPDHLNGLGATEMHMLQYVQDGCTDPRSVLYGGQHLEVFNEREAGELLDELAQCPSPLVFGLGEGPFEKDEQARYRRYRTSKVALTELGQAVVEAEDDFCRHNPIDRWWGGTKLTNERLWRWNRETRSLVAPRDDSPIRTTE